MSIGTASPRICHWSFSLANASSSKRLGTFLPRRCVCVWRSVLKAGGRKNYWASLVIKLACSARNKRLCVAIQGLLRQQVWCCLQAQGLTKPRGRAESPEGVKTETARAALNLSLAQKITAAAGSCLQHGGSAPLGAQRQRNGTYELQASAKP